MNTQTQSIKEQLIKKIAINRNTEKIISEKVIDLVITHQFDSAHKATHIYNSVEISGFGKFIFNVSKAHRAMTKYERTKSALEVLLQEDELSETRRRNAQMKMASVLKAIKDLKPKLRIENEAE